MNLEDKSRLTKRNEEERESKLVRNLIIGGFFTVLGATIAYLAYQCFTEGDDYKDTSRSIEYKIDR